MTYEMMTLDEAKRTQIRPIAEPLVTSSIGRYRRSHSDYVSFFLNLMGHWQRGTNLLSNPDEIVSHPAYARLLSNAELFLPFILEELEKGPSKLVWLLEDHFDERPYPDEDIGDLGRMTVNWIDLLQRRKVD